MDDMVLISVVSKDQINHLLVQWEEKMFSSFHSIEKDPTIVTPRRITPEREESKDCVGMRLYS